MKYIKDFDTIIESKSTEHLDEAVNASGYIKAGKLGYNDQFLGRRSLSWTLSVDLGLKATDQFVGPWIGFDHVSMYAIGKNGGTILDDALTNKYTYEELKSAAAKYLGIKESLVTERDIVRLGKLDDASMVHKILKDEMIKNKISRTRRGDGEVTVYTNDIPNLKKLMDDLGISYELYESAEVNEARFVKSYDKKLDNAKTKEEVLKLYPKAEFFVGKSDHFFGELEPNLFFKAYYTKGQKEFNIKSIYSKKGSNYIHLYNKLGESLTEAKKFKPGDKWSSDFDYDGMLKYALKVNEKTPIKMLNKLFDSATDVNYHTPFANLGIAIDWIEDGDKAGAKDYIKNFHEDIKKEIKNQS